MKNIYKNLVFKEDTYENDKIQNKLANKLLNIFV